MLRLRGIRLRSQRDLAGGLALVALGAAVLWWTADLPVGRATNMGAGYIPRLLAWLVLAAGALIAALAFAVEREDRLEPWPLARMAIILLPIVAFGYIVKPLGIVPAGALLCFVTALAAFDRRPLEALAVAVVLPVLAGLLFVHALNLPLTMWPDAREIATVLGR